MKFWLCLLPLSLVSGCGLNLTYLQADRLSQPAPVEQRDGATTLERSATLVSQAVTHTVQRGDTLYAIARRYQQSVATLAAKNKLAPPYTLHPGQVLQVGASANSSAPTLLSPTPAPRDQTPTRRVAPDFNRYTAQSVQAAAPLQPLPTTAPPSGSCLPSGQWLWPSQGQLETTYTRTGRLGINIFGQLNQPVVATASGKTIYSGVGVNGYESNLIIIQHSPKWLSIYSHTRNRRVTSGQFVAAGQTIADMGLDLQNRAVLHFELSCQEKTVNPLSYLPPR